MVSSTFVGWMITLGFILILVIGFFIGFWRGLKRSTVNLVISIIGVLVSFFVTPVITNAVLGINVTVDGTQTTIQGAVVELIKSDPDIKTMMLANKNMEIFFTNLPKAVFNTVIFILVTIAIEGILYIVYKVLALTVFKVKKDDKKHKLSGGIVGLVKTFVVMLLAFMPLAGLSGMANNLMVQDDYGISATTTVENQEESGSFLEDKLPPVAGGIIGGLENNMLTKMCGIFGLDNAMFDYYSEFEIENEKLYIRKEVDNVYKFVDFTYQLSKMDIKNINFIKVRYDKILNALEETTNSTLFKKVVSETLADIIINYEKYSFIADSVIATEYKDVLDNVKAHLELFAEKGEEYKYFQNDLMEVVSAFKVLGQSGMINEIAQLQDDSIENIAKIISKEENMNALENAINRILDVNIVRDGIVTFVQLGLDQVSKDLDKIDVNTTGWTEEDWDNFTSSVIQIVDDFGDISSEVDVFKVMQDATILLDENENYDIALITSKLGSMIDTVRSNKLLKTSNGTSVLDKILSDNDITLPTEAVINNEGSQVLLTNYTEYFNFISPSLLKLRDEGVYEIVGDSTLSTKQKISSLADIISQTGKNDLLSKIILPLYQVEPTKTLIVEQLTSGLQNDLIKFSTLTNYSEWDIDLDYISDILITLNSLKAGQTSYLSMVLDGNLDGVVDNLSEENVDNVLKPILYAKSTDEIREMLFTSIKSKLDEVSGANVSLTPSAVTLKEDSTENQADEICEVMEKLIAVNKAFDNGATIKTIDKTILGNLLNTMKINAYRKEISAKTETGIFNNAFVNLMTKLKSEYSKEVEYLEKSPEMAELGVDSLAEENYYKINYNLLLSKLAQAEQAQS